MSQSLRIYKVIVCGDEGVGKTSVIRRYSDDKFEKNYTPTLGLDFTVKLAEFGGTECQFAIWDLGGQPTYAIMRSYYMRQADGALVCFDVSRPETLKSVANWLELLTEYAKENVKILVVATKSDLERKHDPQELVQYTEYKEVHGITETSALNGLNISYTFDQLFDLIVKQDG